MKKEIIVQLNKTFEESTYTRDGIEYWMARDLQKLLDSAEWRNFLQVVEKAKTACLNSRQNVSDHFVDVNKMVIYTGAGSGVREKGSGPRVKGGRRELNRVVPGSKLKNFKWI